ncbi:VWA domain-containing protein [Sediminitomix flava]|uniref:Ca-activated chloride channel family protein n=1 Tax=Sediminitomix flava TaxID=379075 RepID=A0A315ZFB8_SEDFL|nr:VWA domain-containing protein [Sediminitomix flava]PWJ44255.1 Ca-activated chloride channel family protein [Sediminitomix flava]
MQELGSANMNFEIAYPWVFFLLPLPFLMYWILPPLRVQKDAFKFAMFNRSVKVLDEAPRKSAWIAKRNIVQWASLWIAWSCLLAALSWPRLVAEPEMKVKTSRSFLVAADISFSMDTKDWKVDGKLISRWEATKKLMSDFIEKRKGDRLGLIFFGSNPYLQAPLTTDLETVEWLLDQTEVGMAGQVTNIGSAITYANKVLEKDTLDHKVLLLLTDGRDSEQDVAPMDAVKAIAEDSVKIYTMGIGDPTQKGSDLDEKTLKSIAEATNGKYFLAMDQDQMEKAYEVMNELEPMEFEEEEYRPEVPLYYYPLGLSLFLILIHQVFRGIFHLFFQKA